MCCVVEYLGTRYAGFQRQPEMLTVQEVLEEAVSAVTQEGARVVGSGRTDAGAHALRQVVAFSTDSRLPAETLKRAINAHLPYDIAVTEAHDAAPDFHPRFDATSRLYRYVIWNRSVRSPHWHGRALHVPVRLDEQAMHEAAQALVGAHDFTSFVPLRQEGSRDRMVGAASCRRDGHLVVFEIEASGFMRQMVRSIAGTLIRVGLHRLDHAAFTSILTGRDRALAADTAPAHGLYLAEVRYAPLGVTDTYSTWGVQARRIEERA
jgi:tRNA pseudouridine38-40 synthase